MPFEFQCVYSVDHIFRKEKKKQREISYSLIANGGRKLAFGGVIPHCWIYYWWTCRGKGNGRHRHLWIVIFVSLFEDPLFFDNFILVYNVSWSHPLVSFTYVCICAALRREVGTGSLTARFSGTFRTQRVWGVTGWELWSSWLHSTCSNQCSIPRAPKKSLLVGRISLGLH